MDLLFLKKQALETLSKDFLPHIDMIEAIRRNTADIVYSGSGGVIIYEKNSRTCMISMQNLINHFLKLNQIPFCQVVTDNLPSLGLQKKLEMSLSSQLTYWLFD